MCVNIALEDVDAHPSRISILLRPGLGENGFADGREGGVAAPDAGAGELGGEARFVALNGLAEAMRLGEGYAGF